MKILQKPGDETELGEREAALIEKEKQVESRIRQLYCLR